MLTEAVGTFINLFTEKKNHKFELHVQLYKTSGMWP